jgi:hypothetical protein
MDVHVLCLCLSCVGKSLAMSWSLIQGVLPYMYKYYKTEIGGQGTVRTVKLLGEKRRKNTYGRRAWAAPNTFEWKDLREGIKQ